MSKALLNHRDKMLWDNANKPDISDVVAEIDDEMDDLLEDHDDKVVDIVGDNMNDLLDAHDDKVVSIVGDNMSTLLTGAASTVQLLANDLSGITTATPVKIGKYDSTRDIYAVKVSGTVPTIESGSGSVTISTVTGASIILSVQVALIQSPTVQRSLLRASNGYFTGSEGIIFSIPATYSENTYEGIIYYVAAATS